MTIKLYYEDPYIQTFSTTILTQVQDENGKWYVLLSETAFYPTGGGQPFDTGTINNVSVEMVEEVNGEIRHYLIAPLAKTDAIVEGKVNWSRRFDHMQQHSGQHILSAAFEELFGYKTIGFHLGHEVLTIDLDIDSISINQLHIAEERANQIILENRPITTKWITQSELSQYPLRKQPTVTEDIRLVIIPEFDYNGCGGTHPSSTGEVRAIKILNLEKQKKKIRVSFICGERVLKQFHNKHQIILEMTKLLNSPESDLIQSLSRVLENVKELENQNESMNQVVREYEVIEMIKGASFINETPFIGKVLPKRTMKELQLLARTIVNSNDHIICLLISESVEESKIQLVAARGAANHVNMKSLLETFLPMMNGKGGGNESFAQGGGDSTISSEELFDMTIKTIKEM